MSCLMVPNATVSPNRVDMPDSGTLFLSNRRPALLALLAA
jgi:hypothetical protein